MQIHFAWANIKAQSALWLSSPVSWTVVFSVRSSLVLVDSSMSWGTKRPLCVWGFHPVTQGAVCVCVCVCVEVAEPQGIRCEVSSVTPHKRVPSFWRTQVLPLPGNEWKYARYRITSYPLNLWLLTLCPLPIAKKFSLLILTICLILHSFIHIIFKFSLFSRKIQQWVN